ncbi:MAG: class II aldolase/adducin family protein [Anaerolineales bacterium]|jgi:L-fuculose-phosphate aldolase
MNDQLTLTRAKICEIGALLYTRGLTDTAGGNISARVGERICMTPRYAGSRHHWNLRPEQVLVLDSHGQRLEGAGEVSREVKVHLRLHADMPEEGMAVVHGHARNVLVFCSTGQAIPPVLETTLKLGEVKLAEYAPSHSRELAENVASAIRTQWQKSPSRAAVLVPWHGIFVVAQDLDAALDVAERVDTNARCILLGNLLMGSSAWVRSAQQELLKRSSMTYQME